MEPVTPSARRIRMMSHGPLHRGLVVAAEWGLLCAVVAGCGSVVASTGASSTPAGGAGASHASASGGGTAAGASASAGASGSSASAGAPAALVGCASVNQATAVSVIRLTRLEVPLADPLMVTDRKPAQVRALFRDFCNAVTHPESSSAVMSCPADFGTNYSGVFYDGNRVLARYIYDASGCRRVDVIVGSMTRSTILAGPAASAAPHLVADFAVVMTGAKPSVIPTTSNMNRGGTV